MSSNERDLYTWIALQRLKKPFRTLVCPDCQKTIKAEPYWIHGMDDMVDWFCPDCWRPIPYETVVLTPKKKLIDYLREVWEEEFPVS